MKFHTFGAALALALAASTAQADCNTDKALRASGHQVFESRCAICHTVGKNQPHTFGPNLRSIIGRPIGKAAGFDFSQVLASQNANWDEKLLDVFLKEPAAAFPGTAMPFAGLEKAEDRTAVVCYLKRGA